MYDRSHFSASNLPYFYYPLEDAFASMAAAGYQAVELFAGTPHCFVDPTGSSGCAGIRELAGRYGLSLRALHPETLSKRYTLCVEEPEWRALSMEFFRRNLELAAELEIPLVTLDGTGTLLDRPRAEAFDRCAENLSRLADYAEQLGIDLALAASPRQNPSCVHTVQELADMLRAVAHPRLKALLSLPAMEEAGESIPQWFDRLGPAIAHVHFCDARLGVSQVWGQGILPLKRCLAQLEAAGYAGLLCQYLENDAYQDEPAQTDRENMRALGAGCGWPASAG